MGEVRFEIRVAGPTVDQQKPELHSPDRSLRRPRPAGTKRNEVTSFTDKSNEPLTACALRETHIRTFEILSCVRISSLEIQR